MPKKGYVYDDVELLADGDIMTIRIRTSPPLIKRGIARVQVYEWQIDGELTPDALLIQGELDSTGLRTLSTAALNMAAYLETYQISGVENEEV